MVVRIMASFIVMTIDDDDDDDEGNSFQLRQQSTGWLQEIDLGLPQVLQLLPDSDKPSRVSSVPHP